MTARTVNLIAAALTLAGLVLGTLSLFLFNTNILWLIAVLLILCGIGAALISEGNQ